MEMLVIIFLLLVGWVLFGVEIFVAPGVSVAGIGAVVSLLCAVGYAFGVAGYEVGFLTLGVAILGVLGGVVWFMKSKTIDKLSLQKTLDYQEESFAKNSLKLGDKGMAVTRLALIGNIDIGGNIIEAKSLDGFIEEGTPIEIVRIDSRGVWVRMQSDIIE